MPTNQRRKIIFRADGNSKMGLGHVIRSCALADMLRDSFECHFYIRDPLPDLQKEIELAGAAIHILPDDCSFDQEAFNFSLHLGSDEIVVLDGYHFDTAYQQTLKRKGCKLVCIDDIHAYHFLSDVVINHAGGLSRKDYSVAPFAQVYLGPAFALLRMEFLQEARSGNAEKNDEVFISLGGADINNDVLAVLQFLEKELVTAKCNLVIGSAYLHAQDLNGFMQHTRLNIEVIRNASPEQMVLLMKRSRYAFCPPSSVAFEYSSVGGELYLKLTADNQKDVLAFFLEQGLAFDWKDFGTVREDRRIKAKAVQAFFFDGQSDSRLRKIFSRLSDEISLKVRPVKVDDLQSYYEWANDPEVRAAALNPATIPMSQHVTWFNNKIADEDCFMYVVGHQERLMGQVRFEVDHVKNTALIHYSIDKSFRNKGMGAAMLRSAGKQFLSDLNKPLQLNAIVRKENMPSNRVFENLGFTLEKEEIVNGCSCNIYQYSINSDHV